MQLSNKNHNSKDLSILVLKDGFSFCTQEQTYVFPFEETLPKESDIKSFLSSHGIASENIRIYHFDTPCVLVPSPLFEEKTKDLYLSTITPVKETEMVFHNAIPSLSTTVVYPQNKIHSKLLKACFPKAIELHFTAALLPYLKEAAAGSAKRHLYVHLRKNCFDLFLFQGSQLLLYNSYEQKNADDFLYYLFYVTEQFYLKPDQFKLYFLGNFNGFSEYYKGVADFHPEVEYLNLESQNQENQSAVPFFQNFFG